MRKVSLWPVVARRDRGWAASRDRRKRTADGSACDRSPLRQRSITHSPVGGGEPVAQFAGVDSKPPNPVGNEDRGQNAAERAFDR